MTRWLRDSFILAVWWSLVAVILAVCFFGGCASTRYDAVNARLILWEARDAR